MSGTPLSPSPPLQVSRKSWICLALILLVAALLRYPSILWGLPEGLPFADESLIWGHYLTGFAEKGFHRDVLGAPRFAYPPLAAYLAGLASWASLELGWVDDLRSGRFAQGIGVGRILMATIGLLSVPLGFLAGRQVTSDRAGLLIAGLLAFVPVVVLQTQYLSVDSMLLTVATGILLIALRLRDDAGRWNCIAAGALCGIAFATKYNGIVLILVPAFTLVLNQGFRLTRVVFGKLLILGGSAVIAGALGCPTCLRYPSETLAKISFYRGLATFDGSTSLGVLGPWSDASILFGLEFPHALGILTTVAIALGFFGAIRRFDRFDVIILFFLLVTLLPLYMSSLFFPRYLILPLPALLMLVGRILKPTRVHSLAAVLLLGAVIVQTLMWIPRFSVNSLTELRDRIAQNPDQIVGLVSGNLAGAGYDLYPMIRSAAGKSLVVLPSSHGYRDDALPLDETCGTEMTELIISERTINRFYRDVRIEYSESVSDYVRRLAPCWKPVEKVCEDCRFEGWGPTIWARSSPDYGTTPFLRFVRQR